MASALDTIAHVVIPNVMKLKTAATLISAAERRDPSAFAQVWQATGLTFTPQLIAKEKGDYRFGVMSLPAPTQMGEAHLCAFVAKKNDPAVTHYFTLEYDYVLATKQAKTILCGREGARTVKHGDGPAITGDFQTDANAFIDAIENVLAKR
ncbi:MAG TPA: hypothetical protein VLT45_08310 [Kofleriaceae bacterium]|nr:hypothetical protein [Kofleriaceae bacterium]